MRASPYGYAVIDDAVLDGLRNVHVSRRDLSLASFPDFLIVGPQRTGTTWLHANLREHQEIFLAEPKEIFFFNRLKTPDHPKFESNDLSWYLKFFRDSPLRSRWRRGRNHGRARIRIAWRWLE